MPVQAIVKPNQYADSMSLMALSTRVNELPYVSQAMISMGTDLNKQVIAEVGLSTPEVEAATTRDQIIVVQCETEQDCARALDQVEELRTQGVAPAEGTAYRTTRAAMEAAAPGGLVVISVPGEYAADEARKALAGGRNVMLFSDNVALADEIELKRTAHERGLLVMGPDCGTAIINGVGLCFANAVDRGPVGVVAASGTSSQELSVQVHALGSGISQLVGVGGRDLSEDVGGLMMLDALALLGADPSTRVVILLSKPPAASVATTLIEAAGKVDKPVVVCFIGADAPAGLPGNVTFVPTSSEAALTAVRLATGDDSLERPALPEVDLEAVRAAWVPGQTDIRGLFCGGTLCDEVFHAVRAQHPNSYSNAVTLQGHTLAGGEAPHDHAFVDLGSDEYTQGRPHPMIDPTLRNASILQQAADPRTAVLLLDVELGYGSHPDPAGAALPSIQEAKRLAADAGRPLEVVAYVLGTDADPQDKAAQEAKLRDAGVRLVPTANDLATLALKMIP